jgi:hypothetical protein
MAFKRLLQRSIGTTAAAIGSYVVPTSTVTTVIGLTVANISDTEITTYNTYIAKKAPLPVGSTLVPIGGEQKVILLPNDSIKVVASTANSVDVIMSILESAA